jgi:hypothetical protein
MPRSSDPHAAALRKGRVSIHGQAYHVIARCVAATTPFSNCDFAFAACRSLHLEAKRLDAVLHAWVLMPDHLHLLVELGVIVLFVQIDTVATKDTKDTKEINDLRSLRFVDERCLRKCLSRKRFSS